VGDQPIHAWRCEECRRWISPESAPYVVIVDDISAQVITLGGYEERMRTRRHMVVCQTCQIEMGVNPWNNESDWGRK
jgi:hypothetical protein